MAQQEDITIDQGADFAMQLQLAEVNGNPKDLTSHFVTGTVKKTYTSDSADTFSFSSSINEPTDGIVTLTLSNTITDTMKPGRYVYDVELSFTDSALNTVVERILEGTVYVTPSVSR